MKKIVFIASSLIIISGCSRYICPEEYELEDNKCIMLLEKEPEPRESCETNYELKDGQCIRETIYNAISETSCPQGYVIIGNECSYYNVVTAERTTSCPEGFNFALESGSFTQRSTRWCEGSHPGCTEGINCWRRIQATVICESCPSGYTQNSTSCICERNNRRPITRSYRCNEGDRLSGNECIKQGIKEPFIRATCSDGYNLNSSGKTCIRREEIPATRGN